MAEQTGRQRHRVFIGAFVAVLALVVLASFFGGEKSGFRFDSVSLTDDIQSETRPVSGFDRVYFYGPFETRITAGEDFSLVLEGDRALLALLKTEVKDGRLSIGWDEAVRINSENSVVVSLGLPMLQEFVADGAISATIDTLNSADLAITLNGAGDVTLLGTCAQFLATANGAGKIDARSLHCQDATLTINGAGNMAATVDDKVIANINGVGNIDVYGGPDDVTVNKAGFGNVVVHETVGGKEGMDD